MTSTVDDGAHEPTEMETETSKGCDEIVMRGQTGQNCQAMPKFHVHTHVHICAHVCTSAHMCAHMCICAHLRTCVHNHAHYISCFSCTICALCCIVLHKCATSCSTMQHSAHIVQEKQLM